MEQWVWLVPVFPVIGLIINGLLGRKIGDRAVGIVGSGVVGLSFLLSVALFLRLLQLPPHERFFEKTLFRWIVGGDFAAEVGFQLDPCPW